MLRVEVLRGTLSVIRYLLFVNRKGLSLRGQQPWLAPRIIKIVTCINWELGTGNLELVQRPVPE